MRGSAFIILCILCVMLAGSWGDAVAATPIGVTDCDRLAANPPDPDRVTAGVERRDVDLPGAIAACLEARRAHPQEARFSYQLGRVYFYDGQTDKALESFQHAIDLNYRQAKFLVGLIMSRGYEGVPADICRVERLWRSSAEQNHANAQVSYVHFALMGRFDGCDDSADTEQMRLFLEGAAPQLDYVGALLITNLTAGLNNGLNKK
jgi:tetratricopeptide (TPR) repeat protein